MNEYLQKWFEETKNTIESYRCKLLCVYASISSTTRPCQNRSDYIGLLDYDLEISLTILGTNALSINEDGRLYINNTMFRIESVESSNVSPDIITLTTKISL